MTMLTTPDRDDPDGAPPGAPMVDPDELMRRAFPMQEAGDLAGAEVLYRRILSAAPDYADAHYLLGRIAQDRGQIDRAIQHLLDAVRYNDKEAAFHKTLGDMHFSLGQWREAVVGLGNAAALQPDDPDTWNSLGCAHEKLGQLAEASRCFEQVVRLSPDSPGAINNAALALKDLGRTEESLERFRHGLAVAPDNLDLLSNYLYALNFSTRVSPEECFAEHAKFDARFGSGRFAPMAARAGLEPDRRLRIAYLSPDLRSHPVACFLDAPLRHHDHALFEIACYALNPQSDAVTERLKKLTDRWVECGSMDDQRIAERIVQDRIDILVDLAGHTGNNRIAVLGRKPAPVIATWLGYPNTTGLKTVDYRITDAVSDPEGGAELNTEMLLRLPQHWCFTAPAMPARPTSLPALATGQIRFGSFNHASKLGENMLRLWARILQRVEGSTLLVWGVVAEHAERIRHLFAQSGTDPARLTFSERTSLPRQLEHYQHVDIALDTFPYSGVTTSFNSLWMGVPVVTLAGRTSASRSTLSILQGLGLADWAGHSEERYLEIATAKAKDLGALAALRLRLRQALERSAFMDGAAFTHHLEAAYRDMWRRHCATAPSS